MMTITNRQDLVILKMMRKMTLMTMLVRINEDYDNCDEDEDDKMKIKFHLG